MPVAGRGAFIPRSRADCATDCSKGPPHGEPSPASSRTAVVRSGARHSRWRGETREAEEFRNVYEAMRLCIGARVMLTQNQLWGVGAALLGLMSGARRVVVAIYHAAPGVLRVDGSAMVHLPDYAGLPCIENLPQNLGSCTLCGASAQARKEWRHASRSAVPTGVGSHDTQISRYHRARGFWPRLCQVITPGAPSVTSQLLSSSPS